MRICHALCLGRIFATFACMILTGCGGLAPLSDGQISAMDASNNRLREQFVLQRQPLPRQLSYRPIRDCRYVEKTTRINGSVTRVVEDATVKSVRDRLLITFNDGKHVSTALISYTGRIYDFNIFNQSDRTRVNTDDYSAYARREAEDARGAYGPTSHAINGLVTLIPEYLDGRRTPNEVVAYIFDETGSVWARFIYRGMTWYKGSNAFLIDMVRTMQSVSPGEDVLVGFNVVETRTLMPLLQVMDAGTKVHVERSYCR
jgi:hypothetical protein